MNYKGNAFSLGKDAVCDAVLIDGKINFLQKSGAAYNHRAFDIRAKSFKTIENQVSYADLCWFYKGLTQLFGQGFVVGN